MTRTYHIVTFGCQMNTYDSELMEGIMAARGWTRAAAEEDADVILYNTCVVRDHAEQRALARLAQLKTLKKERPGRIVGVTGCMAQKDAEALLARLPHLDLVLGPRAIPRLSPLLDAILATGQPQVCVEILEDSYPADAAPLRQRPLKALVNIIFGCNKNCSYCIVPRVRGREVSRPPEAILAEVRALAASGCKEITLIGQNVNSYRGNAEFLGSRTASSAPSNAECGMRNAELSSGVPPSGGASNAELNNEESTIRFPQSTIDDSAFRIPHSAFIWDFAALLRQVAAAAPGAWVRYITSHPRDCNDAHVAAVAECPNVCENFHLPAQAGSSAVLRAMRRGYTRERYLELIDKIRARIPEATLTTDLIVGFPGETGADYEQTLDLVRRVRFDAAFMYLYSPRPGTPAAEEFPEQIPLRIKKERLARLIELQEAIALERNREAIGRRLTVLVEDAAPRTPGDLLARTRGDKMVILPGPPEWIGRFLEVEILDANGHTMIGRAV